jgi:H+-transporting ATPase
LQVFSEDLDKDIIILLAARASRMENKDAIDTAIIGMLADPKEVNVHQIKDIQFQLR